MMTLLIIGLVIGIMCCLAYKNAMPFAAVFAIVLVVVTLNMRYPWWMDVIGFSLLGLMASTMVFEEYYASQKIKKILNRCLIAIIILTTVVVITDTVMTQSAVSGDERITELIQSISYDHRFDFEGYKKSKDEGMFSTNRFPSPYVYYFLNASGGATSLKGKLAKYGGRFFPTSGDMANVKTVIVAVRYESEGYSYDVLRNGVKTGRTRSIYRKKGDLYFFNLETKEYYVMKEVMAGKMPNKRGGGRTSFNRYALLGAMKDLYREKISNGANSHSVAFAHNGEVNALAITPDGKILISGGSDHSIKFWSLPGDTLIKTIGNPAENNRLEAHNSEVRSLAVSPDGKILVSCSFDKTIKFWSLPDGAWIKTIENPEDRLLSVAISPDGKMLVSSSYANDIKFWSFPEGELLKKIELQNFAGSLIFSPDGKILVSRGDDKETIQFRSLPEGTPLNTLKGDAEINELTVSVDGKWLISGSYNTFTIWNLQEGTLVKTVQAGGQWIEALAVNADSKLLITGDINNTIRFWSLPEGKQIKRVEQGKHIPYCIAVSPDGTLFASGKSDGSIQIRSLPSGEMIAHLVDPSCSENN